MVRKSDFDGIFFNVRASYANDFKRQLRKLSKEINEILSQVETSSDLSRAQSKLRAYAELLKPWASEQASNLVWRIHKGNERAWLKEGKKIGMNLSRLASEGGLSPTIERLSQEIAKRITNIPLVEAERIGKEAQEIMLRGSRVKLGELTKLIQQEKGVSEKQAINIAQTEVSTANTILVQARAISLGSEGYIWRTAEDSRVRPSHRAMDGKFVYWSNPPTLDGMTGHAGELPNCRCLCIVVLPGDSRDPRLKGTPTYQENFYE